MARTKYNVSQKKEDRTFDGIPFDSVLEGKFYRDVVKEGVSSGKIASWDRQVVYVLQEAFKRNGKTVRPIEYKADFVITYADGNTVVVDVKGMSTPVFELKQKMFWKVYPELDLQVISYSKIDGGYVLVEQIKAGRKTRKKEKELKEKNNE